MHHCPHRWGPVGHPCGSDAGPEVKSINQVAKKWNWLIPTPLLAFNRGMSKRVLCLLAEGFEEIETITPVDLLRRAGAEVVLASMNVSSSVKGRCDVTVLADQLVSGLNPNDFDMLFLPGGPGVKAMRADGRPALLAAGFIAAGKPVAAICAAPTILADAGLLAGRRFTAHFSVYGELNTALSEERVVEDGLLITSRGAGTALEFGLALVNLLFGEAKAAEVAKSIMA